MSDASVVCIGIGTACGFGYGKEALTAGLSDGRNVFGVLKRDGREPIDGFPLLGVEMPDPPRILSARDARSTGFSGQVALAVLQEAWTDAGLEAYPSDKIGLIVAGSNLQTREQFLRLQQYSGSDIVMVPPRAGYTFFDTDIASLCAEHFGIEGLQYTVGGASASGAMAVHQAVRAVQSGQVETCIALAPVQDLGAPELYALRNLGAMGSDRFADTPEQACRPFDAQRDGFLFGEMAAALVFARVKGERRGYGTVAGLGCAFAAKRGPEPSPDKERDAIDTAFNSAGTNGVDLIVAHATATARGDDVEAGVLKDMGLKDALITAPKSAIGHGISAAGAMEIAIGFLQMENGCAYPIRNLEHPIEPDLNFVTGTVHHASIESVLTLSFGFGGINYATVLKR